MKNEEMLFLQNYQMSIFKEFISQVKLKNKDQVSRLSSFAPSHLPECDVIRGEEAWNFFKSQGLYRGENGIFPSL